MEEHAVSGSKMRKIFRDRASRCFLSSQKAIQMGLATATELSKKIQNRGDKSLSNPNEIRPAEYKEHVSAASRKKGKHRPKVTLREKIEMVHKVINQYHSVKEVAKEFRISQPYVSRLCVQARKNPKFLSELSAEEVKKDDIETEVIWAVGECLDENKSINSLKELREWLKEEKHLIIKPWKLRNILFAKMKLRYKRIEPISW